MISSLALQLREERRHAQAAQLTAARMEIELLKKNLQPHFLLNTLTAVSEVIEGDPKGAVKFIDDLAAEFRSMAQMSGERLVPLKRELELCRLHLRVISRRTGRDIGLAAEGIEDEALVPPALFLTLIENGLVHQQPENGAMFRLVATPGETSLRFAFVSPGRTRDLPSRPAGGTGLRYVKARLEESFPGRWTLSQGAVGGGWETIIGWRPETGAGGAA
jgi:LytS/YehU family sensor histidine kinase